MPDRDFNIGRVDSLRHVAGKKNIHNEVDNKDRKREREHKRREKHRQSMQEQLEELIDQELDAIDEQDGTEGEGHIDFHA